MSTARGAGSLDGLIRRSTLPGGVRVVTESIPGTRSACIGLWVGIGSRHETPGLAGATHFLEHLLFKGTPTRGSLDIAVAFDAVGGDSNAFTSKEHTCYYAHVLDSDLPMAVDVLADMLCSSLIKAGDVKAERSVVLEEIAMHDDEPADLVHDAFDEAMWGDSPLGRPIIGTVESLQAMSRARIASWYAAQYAAPAIVVSAAGSVDHSALVRRLRRALEPLSTATPTLPRVHTTGEPARVVVRCRPTEQVHLVMGVKALHRGDPRRHVANVLVSALGGSMSSRLFQEIREKRGLVYTVAASSSAFTDDGVLDIYAGCTAERLPEVLEVTRQVVQDVWSGGLTAEEVTRAKGQLRGGFALSLEDPAVRMERLGRQELHLGRVDGADEVLAGIAAVTTRQVRDLARELLGQVWHAAAVGDVDLKLLSDAL
jgi:predicted Zn-dependent peptidase